MADEPRKVTCLGYTLDSLTLDEAAARCVGWCRAAGKPRVVMPINAAIVVAMRRDHELRHAFDCADLTVADGASMLWAARLAGEAFPERVAGIDLMQRLVEMAAEAGLSVFLLGAKPDVVTHLADLYRSRYPTLRIAGMQDGYFADTDRPRIVERIRASGADMLFIGMPSPFKEVWACRNREALGVPVILGVGGSFDVLAGFVPRAPRILQRAGLEWLWRLLCEPRRMWKRYLVSNTLFILMVARDALRSPSRRPA